MPLPEPSEEALRTARDLLFGPRTTTTPRTTPASGRSTSASVPAGAARGPSESGEEGPGTPASTPTNGDSGTGPTSGSTTSTTASTRKRGRKSRSAVWNDFDPVFKEVNGDQVRYAATCKLCKSTLSASSSGGTGHLLRHRASCLSKSERSARTQSLLQLNADGSVRSWEYSSDVARLELCRLIVSADLPISFGESDAFERYITRAHNPRFTHVSRQTTTRDFVKFYNERRAALMQNLQSTVSSVALTADIWSGKAKEDYLSVVAHYVNSDWMLEKRVLGMRLIDVSHSGINIAERMQSVIDDFGLSDRVFSVTLDNASANTNAMAALTPKFSGYIGPLLLHQRCACHIINLIVKSGLKRLKIVVENFRLAISFLNSSNQRIAAYKSYCLAMGVIPRKFNVDMDVRWNSTFLMLKHLLPHRSTFSVFINGQYQQVHGHALLTPEDWYVADKVCAFLELFFDSTVALSGVYYPTSPLIMHQMIEIAGQLHQ